MAQGVISENIAKAFGRGFPLSSIISSASLVVLCLFYVYSAATFAHLIVYPLIDRVTYYTVFDVYITNEYVDHVILGSLLIIWLAASSQKANKTVYYVAVGIPATVLVAAAVANNVPLLEGVALASLPAIVALLLYNRYSAHRILKSQQQDLTLNYFGILGIILGVIGLIVAIASIVSSNVPSAHPARNYGYDLFVVLSSFSPILILLLITCIPVKLFADLIIKTLRIRLAFESASSSLYIKKRVKVVLLSFAMLIAIVLAAIPHLPALNPDAQKVGVDSGYYVTWVNNMTDSTSAQEFLRRTFVEQSNGDRPISLLLIYAIHSSVDVSLFTIVEYLPVILGPSLIFAVYFLTRELTSNDVTSILAAFLTAVSFHTLIGIYAGFYANWLALVFGYVSLVFLFRFLKYGGNRNLLLFGGLLLVTLFSHVYTWSILTIVGGIFLILVLLKPNLHYEKGRRNAAILLSILFLTVAVDVAREVVTGASGGIERDLQIASRLAGPEQFALRWNNLAYTMSTFVGGQFANFIILGLALYWLVRTGFQVTPSVFLMIFMSIGILPFLFGEWVIQTRVFYDIPFQIPAAVALFQTTNRFGSTIRTLSVQMWLITLAIIAVSNFHLTLPNLP